MTFSSAWIEDAPAAGSVTGSEATIAMLGRPPGNDHYWVPLVSIWADGAGKPLEYVDGCWIRVTATGSELSAFLEEVFGRTEFANEVATKMLPDQRYVLVAEEF